ncbi:DNA topoisomerase [Cokeromyces recurvatus]|uniref:DNA topoisomerase n=1 Tax=Cokeromyces recurvatus TaxID=90255 RepID=UPI00221FB58B|nr:DNA topoisomerase [Cokeromyces recurvatus]KAI7907288.1 DNA topoisomerase [Cokeromyces recurvatus]
MSSDSDQDFKDDESEDNFQIDSGDESDDFVPISKRRKTTKTAIAKETKTTEKKTPIKRTTVKKAVPTKKTAKNPSTSSSSSSNSLDNFFSKETPASTATTTPIISDVEMTDAPALAKKAHIPKYNENKTIEEIYQKKTQLEHILLRPDTYIGSIEAEEQEIWVFDSEEDMIKKKKIKYVPGLYKIVDEILVNAADNKIRDPSMNTIKVVIDRAENFISIHNNGRGIPITEHKDEKCYVPELIFGHLLTSSNYDDNEKKVTGGRNGYGAKLCNIFSTEFIVETADKERQLKYRQVFKDNMSVIGKPKITSNSKGEEFTRISFKPDLAKFGMTEMDEDFEALIKKRVYDLAGCVSGVNVYLNGTKIPVKGFSKYCDLYTKSMEIRNAEGKKPIISDGGDNPRWEVHFAVSDGQFNQISFVNSICTTKGGTHVNYIADQIVKAILPDVQKKTNNKNIRPFQIKNHMTLFINCLIENPSFDSQTKENMTLRASSFGSTYKLSDKFIKAILTSGMIDNIIRWVKFKEEEQMTKADTGKMNRRLKIPKLEDANLAGVRPHNKDCTLILTEGDSAKALVLSGLSVVGRDKFGVFPLRGKLLNVRDASNSQILSNAEITNIKAILGLKHNKTYTSVDELRYGRLMLMTDQDHDGSHIKGLLINFIDTMFPSLLDIPGFLLEFITPIIRCKHKRRNEEISFFTIPEYEKWAQENNRNSEWVPKYFKGLGTSDKSDARKYFSALQIHEKEFHTASKEERELIDMAFNKKRALDRKNWLAGYEPGIYIDHNVNKIRIGDFVNRELMLFSMADNIRSIPCVVDGFKPGQRKVFFGCIKRGRNTEIKVAQLANYVAGITQYHHGEASVAATIINMAQDFVGSNNINLLVPAGQFGTRHEGGKSAASPRYLFTRLTKIARLIYHPDDDELLDYLIEEDKPIEPKWYVPILPMVLINGADGIGTGWSTTIPNYNPKDITENIFRLMNDEEIIPMVPWFRGFKGEISSAGTGKFTCNGIAEVTETGHVKITELPVRLWTDSFKDNLEVMRDPKDKKPEILINDFFNNSTDSAVEFTVELDEKNLTKAEDMGLLKAFKITNSISTNNIVCFDKNGKIKKYESPEEILKDFYELRLEYYVKRKEYLIEALKDEYERLDNKAKFIDLVINKKLVYINRKEEDVIADMKNYGLKQIYPRKKKNALIVDESAETQQKNENETGYEYLFSINVRGFTAQKVIELRKQKDDKYNELQEVQGTPPKTFWRRDLEALMEEWEALLKEDELLAKQAKPLATANTKKRRRVAKPKAVKTESKD